MGGVRVVRPANAIAPHEQGRVITVPGPLGVGLTTGRRRDTARRQATRFDWRTAVDGFLRAHSADGGPPR